MPLQNRVSPLGEIVASPERGALMGNRGGCLHDAHKRLDNRQWVSRSWIACRLYFKGRHRDVMAPGRYTELFFLDEATALGAGHRPCAECRRADFNDFLALWGAILGRSDRLRAQEADLMLHAERIGPGREKRLHDAEISDLPDGAFVLQHGAPHLVLGDALLPWRFAGYDAPRARPGAGRIEVITPASVVSVLQAGYRPVLHPSAAGS